ncbi:MAG: hypothetical protein IKO41_15930 [Lachnospiraceae bacterium]|nr:hypothetical protein [Lachnospiraceae bacterium]
MTENGSSMYILALLMNFLLGMTIIFPFYKEISQSDFNILHISILVMIFCDYVLVFREKRILDKKYPMFLDILFKLSVGLGVFLGIGASYLCYIIITK